MMLQVEQQVDSGPRQQEEIKLLRHITSQILESKIMAKTAEETSGILWHYFLKFVYKFKVIKKAYPLNIMK